MADDNNSVEPVAEDSQGQPADTATESSKPPVNPAEQARREQQSKKDQAISQKSELEEQVDFLSAKEAERARDSYVSELVADTVKYPNVRSDDPLFKYATSKEEVEEIATQLQNRFMDLQQDALRSVQTESDQTLTDEQIAEQEAEFEKTTKENNTSTFGQFYSNLTRRKR
jgi:hypothetical protein